jgi:nebulin
LRVFQPSWGEQYGQNASESGYKTKFTENNKKLPFHSTMDYNKAAELSKANNLKISDKLYHQKYVAENVGTPHDMRDSVQMAGEQKAQIMRSDLDYKAAGKETNDKLKGFQQALRETPGIKFAKHVKDILSDYKYHEEYDAEKGLIYYPYTLTPMYEREEKAGKMASLSGYKKKDDKSMHIYHMPHDAPSFTQAIKATKQLSDLHYRDDWQGISPKAHDINDSPLIVQCGAAQKMTNMQLYRSDFEKVKQKYHLDAGAPSFTLARYAAKIASDNAYKGDIKKMLQKTKYDFELKDSVEMNHLRKVPSIISNNKYKQDLMTRRGQMISVTETPELKNVKQAQAYISKWKYIADSKDVKSNFVDERFLAQAKKAAKQASDLDYQHDFKKWLKGNLIPLPSNPTVEHALKAGKLASENTYKEAGKKTLHKYMVIPDDPKFKKLREMSEYLSSSYYTKDAQEGFGKLKQENDTPLFNLAKYNKILSSDVAYFLDAREKMGKHKLPAEGSLTLQHQKNTSSLASESAYKQKAEKMMTNPEGWKHIDETRDTKHAAQMAKHSDVQYRKDGKKHLPHLHPVEVDHDLTLKHMKDHYDLTSDISYKAKDKSLRNSYRQKGMDTFTQNALDTTKKISDVEYKQEHMEDRGVWFLRPDAPEFEHAKNMNAIISETAYKKKAKEMQGKVHIPHDLSEYVRMKKLADDISDVKYKEGAADRSQVKLDWESLDLEHKAHAQDLISKKKYVAQYEAEKAKCKSVESTPETQQAKYAQYIQSKKTYSADGKKMQEKHSGTFAKVEAEHDQKVQKRVSNFEYKKEVKENNHKDFHVVTDTPEMLHAVSIGKVQSDIGYKTPAIKVKDIDFSKTPRGKQTKKANKIQSDIEYKREYEEEIKGKGWKFIKDTPVQKHIERMNQLQSDYTYTKEHREGRGAKHDVLERPDIKHATSGKDRISDNTYQKKYKEDIHKGYTVVPDTPANDHARETTFNQSETLYRRKFENKGKGWQVEESPQTEHYREAQKLTDNRTYKASAKELNATGTMFGIDLETPESIYKKEAQALLDNKKYRADFEKSTKGQGLTFDLHGTPMMQHVKQAENIKSDIKYKQDYKENQQGKPTGMLTNTLMKSATKASDIISD